MTGGNTRALLILLAATQLVQPADGYAIFTHQALVDVLWNPLIRPLLVSRYPQITDAQLEMARAYAYGGCAIQDLGYYPFGKDFFSDLTHYVRTGAFVTALFDTATDANEYAFAIGALSHYVGDSVGHARAIDPATGLAFPKLARHYGRDVTYEDAPIDHIRTEFGFDIAQIARRRYAPKSYQKHIGLRVARQALDRAFYQTYGLRVSELLGPERPAIASYRFAVRAIFPEFARAIVVLLRSRLPTEIPDEARRRFLSDLRATDYGRYWANRYAAPGPGAYVLAFLIRILPKVGPLKILSIQPPLPATEDLFFQSFNSAQERVGTLLARMQDNPASTLPNRDLDTGARVKPGAYRRTDQTYAKLLDKVTSRPGQTIPQGVREDLLAFYADPTAPIDTKKHRKAWKKVVHELAILNGRSRCGWVSSQ